MQGLLSHFSLPVMQAYRVLVIEQVETPAQMAQRNKAKGTKDSVRRLCLRTARLCSSFVRNGRELCFLVESIFRLPLVALIAFNTGFPKM